MLVGELPTYNQTNGILLLFRLRVFDGASKLPDDVPGHEVRTISYVCFKQCNHTSMLLSSGSA